MTPTAYWWPPQFQPIRTGKTDPDTRYFNGSVIVCGYFVSTVWWKYSLFLRFSPWREPRPRHFSGYPFGASRKRTSTIFYNTAFQYIISACNLHGKAFNSPFARPMRRRCLHLCGKADRRDSIRAKVLGGRGVGFGEGATFLKKGSPLPPQASFPFFPRACSRKQRINIVFTDGYPCFLALL